MTALLLTLGIAIGLVAYGAIVLLIAQFAKRAHVLTSDDDDLIERLRKANPYPNVER